MASSCFFLWAVISCTHVLLSSIHRRTEQSWPVGVRDDVIKGKVSLSRMALCVPQPDFMLLIHGLSVFRLNYSVSITSNSLGGNTAGCSLVASSGKKKAYCRQMNTFLLFIASPLCKYKYLL